ncbi:hypothetical protein PFFVO_05708 [Plasmodium falciparum Vietnam Oak-Knoll (FVO)]|uniref:TFIIS central domain-containing protein n=1 Tax=Plasmodium falciparum Vietnam Oak-Knoll (FVO) TaxID=1036723 RepID=A0A024UYU4_PLAFA|nr:hypothetical protein PFFVO_05708 [Plasmodium falciparum Vietnam Oak-Knoll (FVO)]
MASKKREKSCIIFNEEYSNEKENGTINSSGTFYNEEKFIKYVEINSKNIFEYDISKLDIRRVNNHIKLNNIYNLYCYLIKNTFFKISDKNVNITDMLYVDPIISEKNKNEYNNLSKNEDEKSIIQDGKCDISNSSYDSSYSESTMSSNNFSNSSDTPICSEISSDVSVKSNKKNNTCKLKILDEKKSILPSGYILKKYDAVHIKGNNNEISISQIYKNVSSNKDDDNKNIIIQLIYRNKECNKFLYNNFESYLNYWHVLPCIGYYNKSTINNIINKISIVNFYEFLYLYDEFPVCQTHKKKLKKLYVVEQKDEENVTNPDEFVTSERTTDIDMLNNGYNEINLSQEMNKEMVDRNLPEKYDEDIEKNHSSVFNFNNCDKNSLMNIHNDPNKNYCIYDEEIILNDVLQNEKKKTTPCCTFGYYYFETFLFRNNKMIPKLKKKDCIIFNRITKKEDFLFLINAKLYDTIKNKNNIYYGKNNEYISTYKNFEFLYFFCFNCNTYYDINIIMSQIIYENEIGQKKYMHDKKKNINHKKNVNNKNNIKNNNKTNNKNKINNKKNITNIINDKNNINNNNKINDKNNINNINENNNNHINNINENNNNNNINNINENNNNNNNNVSLNNLHKSNIFDDYIYSNNFHSFIVEYKKLYNIKIKRQKIKQTDIYFLCMNCIKNNIFNVTHHMEYFTYFCDLVNKYNHNFFLYNKYIHHIFNNENISFFSLYNLEEEKNKICSNNIMANQKKNKEEQQQKNKPTKKNSSSSSCMTFSNVKKRKISDITNIMEDQNVVASEKAISDDNQNKNISKNIKKKKSSKNSNQMGEIKEEEKDILKKLNENNKFDENVKANDAYTNDQNVQDNNNNNSNSNSYNYERNRRTTRKKKYIHKKYDDNDEENEEYYYDDDDELFDEKCLTNEMVNIKLQEEEEEYSFYEDMKKYQDEDIVEENQILNEELYSQDSDVYNDEFSTGGKKKKKKRRKKIKIQKKDSIKVVHRNSGKTINNNIINDTFQSSYNNNMNSIQNTNRTNSSSSNNNISYNSNNVISHSNVSNNSSIINVPEKIKKNEEKKKGNPQDCYINQGDHQKDVHLNFDDLSKLEDRGDKNNLLKYNKVIEKIKQCLDEENVCDKNTEEISKNIVQTVIDIYKNKLDIKMKLFSICSNLMRKDNSELRKKILNGNITSTNLANMDSSDLAPISLQNKRREHERKYFYENIYLRENLIDLKKKSNRNDEEENLYIISNILNKQQNDQDIKHIPINDPNQNLLNNFNKQYDDNILSNNKNTTYNTNNEHNTNQYHQDNENHHMSKENINENITSKKEEQNIIDSYTIPSMDRYNFQQTYKNLKQIYETMPKYASSPILTFLDNSYNRVMTIIETSKNEEV